MEAEYVEGFECVLIVPSSVTTGWQLFLIGWILFLSKDGIKSYIWRLAVTDVYEVFFGGGVDGRAVVKYGISFEDLS